MYIRLSFSMTINKSQGHKRLIKYIFTYIDLFLIMDNYTLLYQESDLLIHLV
jgi:hypothetical protein